MQFAKSKEKVRDVGFDTVRADSEDYFEGVVVQKKLGDLILELDRLFGAPTWPSKDKLSTKAQRIIDGYGGIRQGQTFYFLCEGGCSVFAMLWPWQDGEHITLKMGQEHK